MVAYVNDSYGLKRRSYATASRAIGSHAQQPPALARTLFYPAEPRYRGRYTSEETGATVGSRTWGRRPASVVSQVPIIGGKLGAIKPWTIDPAVRPITEEHATGARTSDVWGSSRPDLFTVSMPRPGSSVSAGRTMDKMAAEIRKGQLIEAAERRASVERSNSLKGGGLTSGGDRAVSPWAASNVLPQAGARQARPASAVTLGPGLVPRRQIDARYMDSFFSVPGKAQGGWDQMAF